jgi:hypothetical protein
MFNPNQAFLLVQKVEFGPKGWKKTGFPNPNTQLSICCISHTMIFSNYYDYFGVIINNTQLSILLYFSNHDFLKLL